MIFVVQKHRFAFLSYGVPFRFLPDGCTLAHLNTCTPVLVSFWAKPLLRRLLLWWCKFWVSRIRWVVLHLCGFACWLKNCWQLTKSFLFKAALVTPTIFITFHQHHSSAGFLGRTRNCIGLIFIFIILLAPVFIIVFVFSVFIHDWNDGWWCFSDVATKPSRHILCRATPSCATPVPHLPVLQHLVLHLCYTIFCRAGPSGSKPTLTAQDRMSFYILPQDWIKSLRQATFCLNWAKVAQWDDERPPFVTSGGLYSPPSSFSSPAGATIARATCLKN